MSPDDEVVKLINDFDTAMLLFAGQHPKLNVVQVVSCFAWTHKPRRWLIETKGVNRVDRKIAEKRLRRELVTKLSSMR
jgi:hypothetical protein